MYTFSFSVMGQAIECVHSMGESLNVYIQWLSCGMCRCVECVFFMGFKYTILKCDSN